MTDINLLPWREERREEIKQFFFIFCGVFSALAIMVMLLVHMFFATKINSQMARNAMLVKEVKLLDRKIKEIKKLTELKQSLLTRMHVIRNLQSNRPQVVHLFDEIMRILPDGVHLTSMERQGNTIILHGRSDSNTNVSDLMRNIRQSKWLAEPHLLHIRNKKVTEKLSGDFNLRCQLTRGPLAKVRGMLNAQ